MSDSMALKERPSVDSQGGGELGRTVEVSVGQPVTKPPFAYEIRSDGQHVRLEAPTLEGLLLLMRSVESKRSH